MGNSEVGHLNLGAAGLYTKNFPKLICLLKTMNYATIKQ